MPYWKTPHLRRFVAGRSVGKDDRMVCGRVSRILIEMGTGGEKGNRSEGEASLVEANKHGRRVDEGARALEQRLQHMEAVLSAIDREIEHALHHPETSLLTVCRISTLVLHARGQ
jgi:hypothetical protein